MNLLVCQPPELVYNWPEGFQGDKINVLDFNACNFLQCGRIQKKKKKLTILKQLFWDTCRNVPTCKLFMPTFFNKGILCFMGTVPCFSFIRSKWFLFRTLYANMRIVVSMLNMPER